MSSGGASETRTESTLDHAGELSRSSPVESISELRARIAQLRRDLAQATETHRQAISRQNAGEAIELLRNRSLLMRELLDRQCELLLRVRSRREPGWESSAGQGREVPSGRAADQGNP
jgi:hypothetical protein